MLETMRDYLINYARNKKAIYAGLLVMDAAMDISLADYDS